MCLSNTLIDLDVIPFSVSDMFWYQEIYLVLPCESFVHGILYLPNAVVDACPGHEDGIPVGDAVFLHHRSLHGKDALLLDSFGDDGVHGSRMKAVVVALGRDGIVHSGDDVFCEELPPWCVVLPRRLVQDDMTCRDGDGDKKKEKE